jgi:hypothetical protein
VSCFTVWLRHHAHLGCATHGTSHAHRFALPASYTPLMQYSMLAQRIRGILSAHIFGTLVSQVALVVNVRRCTLCHTLCCCMRLQHSVTIEHGSHSQLALHLCHCYIHCTALNNRAICVWPQQLHQSTQATEVVMHLYLWRLRSL